MVVVIVDPRRDAGARLRLGGEVLQGAQFGLQGRMPQDSMTALSSAEPGRPMDWRMPSRAQAERTIPAVYSTGSRDRRDSAGK